MHTFLQDNINGRRQEFLVPVGRPLRLFSYFRIVNWLSLELGMIQNWYVRFSFPLHHMDNMPNGSRKYTNMTPMWSRSDANITPKWSQDDANIIPEWFPDDADMTPIWPQIDPEMRNLISRASKPPSSLASSVKPWNYNPFYSPAHFRKARRRLKRAGKKN